MYKNVGKKIKVLAQVLGWLCLAVGIILALVYLTDELSQNDLLGFIGLAVGVVTFIASWFMYGFGQLVDDVRALRNKKPENTDKAPVDELPEL